MNIIELKNKIQNRTIIQDEIEEFFDPVKGDKSKLIEELLEKAYYAKDGSAIDYLLQCIYINGKTKSLNQILCKISEIRDEWQYMNEDIASLLGELGDKKSVSYLYRLATEYPISDLHSIPLKAIWALRKIGNQEAINALRNISNSGDGKKMKMAQEQIEYYFK